MEYTSNHQANEPISKFKLLSSYGGPGSLIHTGYGSIIVSCIEEWGFINRILELHNTATQLREQQHEYVIRHASLEGLSRSNDQRLLHELQRRKQLSNLRYLALIPDIELNEVFNTIREGMTPMAINSTYLPKVFCNEHNIYKSYSEWYRDWVVRNGRERRIFFPPKDSQGHLLKQDNIILICEQGHCSDFPWSRFLRWKSDIQNGVSVNMADIFSHPTCCVAPQIQITDTNANASGFDGKWLRCRAEGCNYRTGVSLKGLMSLATNCPGHRPWESAVGDIGNYYGDNDARIADPHGEQCNADHMRVVLTTGNNVYFSRVLSSLFMPNELFLDGVSLRIGRLENELKAATIERNFLLCNDLNNQIIQLRSNLVPEEREELTDSEREVRFRNIEYQALASRDVQEINVTDDLRVTDVTENLDDDLHGFFSRVLRIDNLKVTSTQLDFSRVEPTEDDPTLAKSIFRSNQDEVLVYPVVENFGEGIFIAFNDTLLTSYQPTGSRFREMIDKPRTAFARNAVAIARRDNWQLYLVHSFSHLLMRELEFRCGYPTASLNERLYSSNEPHTRMHGVMIYTAEGAEGSMGGLIAQTRRSSLNALVKSALKRATVCNSDPLCWNSPGQGLFELNLASCFSCSLVSETSCEKRNIYLDRRILVDEEFGFFRQIL